MNGKQDQSNGHGLFHCRIIPSDGDVTRKSAFAFPWAKRLLALRLAP